MTPGAGQDSLPAFPPPPMQGERSSRPFREIPLPWSILLVAALLSFLLGLLGMLYQGGPYFASRAYAATYMGIAVASGVLMVLGAAILDRLCPQCTRSLRWMIGMALHGFVPLSLALAIPSMIYGQAGAALLSVLLQMAYGVVGGAVTGLVLGLAAERSDGLYLRLSSAGAIAGLARTAVLALMLLARMAAYGTPLSSLGTRYWGALVFGHCACGALLGLAIGACLSSARRANAPGEAEW